MRHPKFVIGTVIAATATLMSTMTHAQPLAATASQPVKEHTTPTTGQSTIDWKTCLDVDWFEGRKYFHPGKLLCGEIDAPLDYSNPDGKKIKVRAVKLPAEGNSNVNRAPIFSLGAKLENNNIWSVDMYKYTSYDLGRNYDIIGVAQRGSRDTAPFRCVELPDRYLPKRSPVPVTTRDIFRNIEKERDFRRDCREGNPEIASFMTTADYARDIDLVRQANGTDQLNMLAQGYGGVVASTYTNMFPNNSRAVVVDNGLSPIAWMRGKGFDGLRTPTYGRLGLTEAHQRAWEHVVSECERVGKDSCQWAETARADHDYVYRVLREGSRWYSWKPLTAETKTAMSANIMRGSAPYVSLTDVIYSQLNYLRMDGAINSILRDQANLAKMFRIQDGVTPPPAQTRAASDDTAEATRKATTQQLQKSFAEARNHVEGHKAAVGTQSAPSASSFHRSDLLANQAALNAVCSETRNPIDFTQVIGAARRGDKVDDGIGTYFAWNSSVCMNWPFRGKNAYRGSFNNPQNPGLLVVGTEFYPRAPFIEGAQDIFKTVPNSRLVKVKGGMRKHSGRDSYCAADRIVQYFENPQSTPAGTTVECDVARKMADELWRR